MKSRLTLPRPAAMSAAQRAIHDEVLRTRGNVSGPFLAWLLSPGLAQPAQQLGAFCRYGSSLSTAESELVILLVAAAYGCEGERQIHEPIARAAGVAAETIDAIRAQQPVCLDTARGQLLAELASELLATRRLGDESFARAAEALGEAALVELVGIVGYYALVAYTLNAFDMRPEAPAAARR